MIRLGRSGRCRSCRQALVEGTAPELLGTEPDVEILVSGFPVLQCPDGHEMRQRPSQDSLGLLHAIDDSIPYVQGGRCPACGSAAGERLDTWTFEVQVEEASSESFGASVTAPAWKCGSCGIVAVDADDRVHAQFGDALVAAFESGQVRM